MLSKWLSIKKVILISAIVAGGIAFYGCLPQPLFKSPVSSILLSKQGKLLGAHIADDGQWRFPPLETVPEKFSKSLVAFEDKRFYDHPGVDPFAIFRAIKSNLKAGRIVSGGSTISMQVVRMASVKTQRTWIKKASEAIQAIRLETRYSKEQILNLYASHAPFGGNVVGLEAASWRYFGRSPHLLSWAESALLAVLPNSPALIHPGRNRGRLKQKRDRLLKRLFQQKHIDELDYKLAVSEPLPEKPKALPRMAPHLLDTLNSGKLSTYNDSNRRRYHTTLDHSLQNRINEVAQNHSQQLALKDIHNLAILIIDNHTFEVKAYIGNAFPQGNILQHGQAIDMVQRPRSTGSTLKPLLFASMIEQGEILPETLIADAPIRYTGYKPKNFDRKYRGAVRAKQALASSLNIPAVNMLSYHGVERFLANLRQMGLSTLHRRSSEYGLPLILGGAEGTLWELSNLYANLANRAQQSRAALSNNQLRPIVLKNVNTDTRREQKISPATAWMTLQALLEVGRPGTEAFWKRFDSTHKIAWKTGTSFGHRDAWAIGTTPKFTVGVWVGNAAGEGRQGMTGVKVAAPILFDVFNRLPLSNDWFKKPLKQMKLVSICSKDGYLANGLCDSKDYYIPENSHFDRVTPHFQRVHLGQNSLQRVHANCESIGNMQHQNWFVLPPEQAHFYRQHHADYKPLPNWRNDCADTQLSEQQSRQITLVYPRPNTQIYIPRELTGQRGKTVFKAIKNDTDEPLFWHLNDEFIGTTKTYHEQAVWLAEGKHTLTLVDRHGESISQQFKVISQ